MHTLRFHMILMHDQQNPLTTSNYILYVPKHSCNIQHAKIHEITMIKKNLRRWYSWGLCFLNKKKHLFTLHQSNFWLIFIVYCVHVNDVFLLQSSSPMMVVLTEPILSSYSVNLSIFYLFLSHNLYSIYAGIYILQNTMVVMGGWENGRSGNKKFKIMV